jgi:DNA-binding LacI/PurR family transcriptional regulator
MGKSLPGYVMEGREVDIKGQEGSARAVITLSNQKRRPDGSFCFNDLLAIGVLEILSKQGVEVSYEMSVIGCGNLHSGSLLAALLSTVDQRSYLIGKSATGIGAGLNWLKRVPSIKENRCRTCAAYSRFFRRRLSKK